MKRRNGLQLDDEGFKVLSFLVGQFQPYFKQGKFTHLKHVLGYRTCYNELAAAMGWEEQGIHLPTRQAS